MSRHGLPDDEGMHLDRALVGQHRLEVVHVPDDRVLERDAVGAEDRAGRAADVEGLADVLSFPSLTWSGRRVPASLRRPRCSASMPVACPMALRE